MSAQEKPLIIADEDMPESLREIKEELGMEAAMILLHHFGGIRVFIPKRLPDNHDLCAKLGVEVAHKCSRIFGGETLSIPRAAKAMRKARNLEITSSYDRGVPVRTLSAQFRLTERQIYTILSGEIGGE